MQAATTLWMLVTMRLLLIQSATAAAAPAFGAAPQQEEVARLEMPGGATVVLAAEWDAAGPRGRVAAQELLLGELSRRQISGWRLAAGCSHPPCVHLLRAPRPLAAACSPASTRQLSSPASEESFVVCSSPTKVTVVASTELGLMMAVGRLLREIRVQASNGIHAAVLPAGLRLAVSPPPWAAMRGHQLTDWGFYMASGDLAEDRTPRLNNSSRT